MQSENFWLESHTERWWRIFRCQNGEPRTSVQQCGTQKWKVETKARRTCKSTKVFLWVNIVIWETICLQNFRRQKSWPWIFKRIKVRALKWKEALKSIRKNRRRHGRITKEAKVEIGLISLIIFWKLTPIDAKDPEFSL